MGGTGTGFFLTSTFLFKITEFVFSAIAFIVTIVLWYMLKTDTDTGKKYIFNYVVFLEAVLLIIMVELLVEIIICIVMIDEDDEHYQKYDITFSMIIQICLCGVTSWTLQYAYLPYIVVTPSFGVFKTHPMFIVVLVFSYLTVFTFALHVAFKIIKKY